MIGRSLALVLATGVFVGGYLMGSGPDHIRLPGPMSCEADGRSMDAETLAAVRWARDGLLPGGRIGADRVSSVLLASQAGLYPVMHEDGSSWIRRGCMRPTNGARRSPRSHAACTFATFMSIGGWPTNCHIRARISTMATRSGGGQSSSPEPN